MIEHLPTDWRDALLLGRLQTSEGPTPILVVGGRVWDVSRSAPTVSHLLNAWSGEIPAGEDLGPLDGLPITRAFEGGNGMHLLAPFDLQCIKAAGVTFAVSAIERVIEERARGDKARADSLRADLRQRVGDDIRSVKPGSAAAQRLKAALIADGLWSQYLEVAIGPDAEIFTKGPPLSSVGWGDWIGVRSDSAWNNPEPEVVLACDRAGRILGATLGNDVNLRDFEGRSALLLGRGQGQQRGVRDRALHPAVRSHIRARRCAQGSSAPGNRRRGGLSPRGRKLHDADQPRSGRARGTDSESAPSVSGWVRSVPRHDVCAHRRSWRAGPGLHAQAGRPGAHLRRALRCP